ncbi:delta-1-pyrroline-5-carboxylate dehydrogenase, mitochondrial-like [Daphnia carinata]|uniref:delta-1-pyrroline-5-carboxylate dehydrogenase, mitochondrial-like n=1 Tax=Daphnia carinata TaxID=120202 RepID=UPI00257A55BB|nr:delta-1-pyrroline-5-carboxylate dehydrogenase, mitochondrial-like [Daphnia carinata]
MISSITKSTLHLLSTKRLYVGKSFLRCLSGPPIIQEPVAQPINLVNEPILDYFKGSSERSLLEDALQHRQSTCEEIPIVIAGKEYWTDDVHYQTMPSNHQKKIAKFCYATPELLQKSISASLEARKSWEKVPLHKKIDIFLKAGDLVSTKYRSQLIASTMLGQGKTVFQAEIDAACELADFLRFNAEFAQRLYDYQPVNVDPYIRNSVRHRGLEGFIAAVSPFNFTAIGGNLAYAPAIMGNVVLWKPSDTAMLSNYIVFRLMEESGIPPGVVNFVPAEGPTFGRGITTSPHLSAINFTGSVPTFHWLWKQVGQNVDRFRNLPRLVGECGGKNYHFVHSSANVEHVVNSTLRGAFEYSGQKCSACSRLYVPSSLWKQIKEGLVEGMKQMKIGPVTEFDTFTSSVIDERAYNRIASYIKHAEEAPHLEIIAGGHRDKSVGYFIHPTLLETKNPRDRIMVEEIFGPVLTAFVYDDNAVEETLELVDSSTSFALTGAVFAEDREFLVQAAERLKMSAGNFYINDKSTGAVVGQQPFGGGRLSGTNDKAGSPHYLLRWTSPQAIKQSFNHLTQFRYPHMEK